MKPDGAHGMGGGDDGAGEAPSRSQPAPPALADASADEVGRQGARDPCAPAAPCLAADVRLTLYIAGSAAEAARLQAILDGDNAARAERDEPPLPALVVVGAPATVARVWRAVCGGQEPQLGRIALVVPAVPLAPGISADRQADDIRGATPAP